MDNNNNRNKRTKKILLSLGLTSIIFILLAPVIIVIIPIILGYALMTEVVDYAKYEVGLFSNYYQIGKVNFNDEEDFWKHIYEKYQVTNEYLENPVNLYGSQATMNINICKEIIDNAIDWAFKAKRENGTGGGYWTEFVKSDTAFEKFFEAAFDWLGDSNSDNLTFDSFLNAQYPYTLASDDFVKYKNGNISEKNYYTIEDYMQGRIPEEYLNNDLNYAEIICAVCLSSNMKMDSFSFKDFYAYLLDPNIRKEFGEISYAIKYGFNGSNKETYSSYEIFKAHYEEYKKKQIIDRMRPFTYAEITMYPYGLHELEHIADIDLLVGKDKITKNVHNAEMLDIYENSLRKYFEMSKDLDVDLGISYDDERPNTSMAYTSAYDYSYGAKTGRSIYTYVDLKSNLYADIFSLPEWDYENIIYPTIVYEPIGRSRQILNFNSSDGSKSYYICQKDYPNDYRGPEEDGSTIAKQGCIDCCFTMAAQYLRDEDISIRAVSKAFVKDKKFQIGGTYTKETIVTYEQFILFDLFKENKGDLSFSLHGIAEEITKNYKFFTSLGFVDAMGLSYVQTTSSFDQKSIIASINIGSPVIFCIRGPWVHEGKVYRSKQYGDKTTHYILIVGYDDSGFYVLNPSRPDQTYIPFKAFLTANLVSWGSIGNNGIMDNNGTVNSGEKYIYFENCVAVTSAKAARFLEEMAIPDFTRLRDNMSQSTDTIYVPEEATNE